MRKQMKVFSVVVTLLSLFIYDGIRSMLLYLIPRRFRTKKNIAGQKVLITGAGNGLGRQLAIQFSKHSTCLVLLDIDKEGLRETSRHIDPNCRAFFYECDISNRKMVYTVARKIKDDVGDVDILVNNAGTVTGKSLIDLPDEKILKTMEVNAISHFWICKSFLPYMMAKNKGHIVTIASVAGHVGCSRLTDYCTSKYAAIGFSESLEMELRSKNLDGIKITIVSPSHIDTGLFDGFRLTFGGNLTPENVAEEIVQGVLEERETIFIPRYFDFLLKIKTLSSRSFSIRFAELTHNIRAMEKFRGRAAVSETSNGSTN